MIEGKFLWDQFLLIVVVGSVLFRWVLDSHSLLLLCLYLNLSRPKSEVSSVRSLLFFGRYFLVSGETSRLETHKKVVSGPFVWVYRVRT